MLLAGLGSLAYQRRHQQLIEQFLELQVEPGDTSGHSADGICVQPRPDQSDRFLTLGCSFASTD